MNDAGRNTESMNSKSYYYYNSSQSIDNKSNFLSSRNQGFKSKLDSKTQERTKKVSLNIFIFIGFS